jgi:hypothetical protein
MMVEEMEAALQRQFGCLNGNRWEATSSFASEWKLILRNVCTTQRVEEEGQDENEEKEDEDGEKQKDCLDQKFGDSSECEIKFDCGPPNLGTITLTRAEVAEFARNTGGSGNEVANFDFRSFFEHLHDSFLEAIRYANYCYLDDEDMGYVKKYKETFQLSGSYFLCLCDVYIII